MVSPLKESPRKDATGSGNSQNVVFALCADGDYERKIIDFGVASENLKKIAQLRNIYCASIKKENEAESKREKTIMNESMGKLREIDEMIVGLRADMDHKRKELNKIYASLNFNCVKEPKDCIEDSKILVDKRIDELHSELLGTKENELIERHTTLVAEDNPPKEIAKKVAALSRQMRGTYSKIDSFFEETEVENFEVTDYEVRTGNKIYRELDRFWIYIVPGDNDRYDVTVVTKFKITGSY